MWMESERLLHPVFREFYAERDVVFEERRMRTESTPLGKFAEEFNAMFWESHPYHWPGRGLAVGHPGDLQGAGGRVLRHLLRAAKHHADSRRRF